MAPPLRSIQSRPRLVYENGTAPTMLDRRLGIQEAGSQIFEPGEELDILSPWQSSNEPLDNFRVWPCFSESAHIEEIGAREAMHPLEFRAEVGRQSIDHFGTPSVPLLALKDIA